MENPSELPSSPLSLQRRIDDCCDRFEAAWKAGEAPTLEAYLEEFPKADRPELFRELLAIEVAYWGKAGRGRPSKDTFLAAHPQFASFFDTELEQVFVTCTDVRTVDTPRRPATDGVAAFGQHRTTRRDSRGLHIRCPHCQNAVELLADSPLEEITCGACGDSFSLVEREGNSTPATPLKRIGRFELTSRLGMGGFGTVWKALDTELDRVVALKIPRKGQLSPREVEQFFREARAAAQLKHPNIVPVHEVGRDEDTIFIVTDLIHGVPLAARLKEEQPSAREAAALCALIADALHFAHQQGVVHRDLKPSNVMIDEAGEPHLMDFGLAKREIGEITMTVEGQILGTPAYMSPEQAQGQTRWIDRRTDIYSLGVVLYEMLTRELPYRGGVQQQIQQRINEDAPSPRKLNAHVPLDLATICLKCLERDPNKRYATAEQLSAEFHRFLRGEPIHARPISAAGRAGRWAARNPAWASVAALTVALAVGGPVAAFLIASQRDRIQDQLDERNQILAEHEREIDKQSSVLQGLKNQQNALIAANPGVEKLGANWRQTFIADYLKQHEPAIATTLQNDKLSDESRAQAEIGVAYMLREVDRPKDALAHFQAASELLSRLVDNHADAETYQIALADCLMHLSEMQKSEALGKEAAASARRALAIRKDLAKQHPTDKNHQLDYLDALVGNQSFASDRVPPADHNELKQDFQKINEFRKKLEQSSSAAPSDLYELGCYLTLRVPLVIGDRENDASP